jgi:hypothetical protein
LTAADVLRFVPSSGTPSCANTTQMECRYQPYRLRPPMPITDEEEFTTALLIFLDCGPILSELLLAGLVIFVTKVALS